MQEERKRNSWRLATGSVWRPGEEVGGGANPSYEDCWEGKASRPPVAQRAGGNIWYFVSTMQYVLCWIFYAICIGNYVLFSIYDTSITLSIPSSGSHQNIDILNDEYVWKPNLKHMKYKFEDTQNQWRCVCVCLCVCMYLSVIIYYSIYYWLRIQGLCMIWYVRITIHLKTFVILIRHSLCLYRWRK